MEYKIDDDLQAAAPFGGTAVGVGAAGGVVALDVDQVEVADRRQHVPGRPRQREALRWRRTARLRRAQALAEHVRAQQLVLDNHSWLLPPSVGESPQQL